MKHDLMPANAVLHRRHAGRYLVETMRAMGMTDDEIRAALAAGPAAEAPTEPDHGQVDLERPAVGGLAK